MKINEVILNEGVFDPIKKAAQSPTAKSVGTGISAAADWAKSKAYTHLGGLGQSLGWQGSAVRQHYLNKFISDYNRFKLSAHRSGVGDGAIGPYIRSYINKYGWSVPEAEIEKITTSVGNDPTKAANAMYMLAVQQKANGDSSGSGAATATADKAPTASDQPSPVATGVISKVARMTDLNDISDVAKGAMQRLNKLDRRAYQQLRKEVITGKKAK